MAADAAAVKEVGPAGDWVVGQGAGWREQPSVWLLERPWALPWGPQRVLVSGCCSAQPSVRLLEHQ